MLTPNYRPGGDGDHDECEGQSSKYPANITCTFDLLVKVSPAIEVVDFNTEKGFDILTVNGVDYSGGGKDTEALQGVAPTGPMTFISDKGFEKTGFRLCPKDPREDMEFVGTFTAKNGTVYAMYVMELKPNQDLSPWPDFFPAGNFTDPSGTVYQIFVSTGGYLPPPPPPPPPAPGPAPGPPAPGPPAPGPAPPPPPPPAPTPPPPEYDDPDAPEWLKIHNYFRCIHNTGPIDWDKDVAAGAATWADRGQMSHAKCYKIPAPRGPSGENLGMGYDSIMKVVTAWYDESPERGPSCGGHCTALLWKKSKALGCSKKNTARGGRPFYVCRYAQSAANFGSKREGVNMPDYSREPQCYGKFPVSKRWKGGGHDGSGSLESQQGNNSVGEGVDSETIGE